MIKVPLRFSYISTFFVSNFYENRRTTRITCSTVSLRFFRADAFIQRSMFTISSLEAPFCW